MSLKADAMIVVGGVALVALAAYFASRKAGQVISAVKPYVDPTDRNNLAYRGVNGIGGAITGDENWNLGGALYDLDQTIDKWIFGVPPVPDVSIAPDFGILTPAAGWQ